MSGTAMAAEKEKVAAKMREKQAAGSCPEFCPLNLMSLTY